MNQKHAHELELEAVAAIMDCVRGDDKFEYWWDKASQRMEGCIGLYRVVVEAAQNLVIAEIRVDDTGILYELSESAAGYIIAHSEAPDVDYFMMHDAINQK